MTSRREPVYQHVRQGETTRTIQLSPGTLVDVDADGKVVGIEAIYGDLLCAYIDAMLAARFTQEDDR